MKNLYAYTAGLLDGDGSITFHKNNRNGFGYNPRILVVSNNDLKIVKFMKSKFKGYIPKCQQIDKEKHNKNWKLIIERRSEALNFLIKISSFLRIKKKQAKLMIKYLRSRRYKWGKNYPITKREFQYAKKVKELNCINSKNAKSLRGN